MFYNKTVLKKIMEFMKKYLCRSLSFNNKVAGCRLAILL